MKDSDLLFQMKNDGDNAARLSSLIDGDLYAQNQLLSEHREEFEHFVAQKYYMVAGDSDNVSISTLLESGEINVDAFQSLCDKDPTLLHHIGGGSTLTALGRVASDKYRAACGSGKSGGQCLTGVVEIYNAAHVDSLNYYNNPLAVQYRQDHPYQGGCNGGSSGYVILSGSGDFIDISVKNQAYGRSNERYTPEDQYMNSIINGLQSGVTVTVDDISDKDLRIAKGNTGGGRWGHIAVKCDQGFCCDIAQSKFNFPRYGEYMHVCFPKDALVDKQTAMKIIAEAYQNSWEPTTINYTTSRESPNFIQTKTEPEKPIIPASIMTDYSR